MNKLSWADTIQIPCSSTSCFTLSLYGAPCSICSVVLVRLSPGMWEKANVISCTAHTIHICWALFVWKHLVPSLLEISPLPWHCYCGGWPSCPAAPEPTFWWPLQHWAPRGCRWVMLLLYTEWEFGVVHFHLTEGTSPWEAGINKDVYRFLVVLSYDVHPVGAW